MVEVAQAPRAVAAVGGNVSAYPHRWKWMIRGMVAAPPPMLRGHLDHHANSEEEPHASPI
jgi:hypothetical protein